MTTQETIKRINSYFSDTMLEAIADNGEVADIREIQMLAKLILAERKKDKE